jgi:uncharacterized protein (DUF924 family)
MDTKPLGRISNILNFWFGNKQENSKEYLKQREKLWFGKDPTIDKEIKEKFELEDYKLSVEGITKPWKETPSGCLAQILVFDQFPRNIFRGNQLMYATDDRALELAKHAITQGYDKKLSSIEKIFIYMPFEHSENVKEQKEGLRLFKELEKEAPFLAENTKYAQRHLDVIEKFGRFPHRNEILGRPSTPEEKAFLNTPGSSF